MSYQKRNITNGDIYHVLNRGTDKRKIFLQEKDYVRFVHNLFEFNDDNPLDGNLGYFFEDNPSRVFARPYMEKRKRKLLVDILAFCLMPNHYHLLLRQRVADGISKFIKRLNMGYAKYFNQKYKRDGSLFQGRYKSIVVKKRGSFYTYALLYPS